MDNSGLVLAEQLHFGFEFTGIYSSELALFLDKHSLPLYLISRLELKRSLGIRRGKSDKADSKYIAEYLYEKQEKIIPIVLPSQTIQDLSYWQPYTSIFQSKLIGDTSSISDRACIVEAWKVHRRHTKSAF